MNLMNYRLYASEATMMRIMAEDAGAAELRDSSFYKNYEKKGIVGSLFEKVKKSWLEFKRTPGVGAYIGTPDRKPGLLY